MNGLSLHSSVHRLARQHLPEIIRIRRDLHRNPELAFNEFRTVREVARRLTSLGFDVQTEINKTGIVATLSGDQSGPVTHLRADMDALPIQEENDFSYKSENAGVMHACGHDGHMASVLGAAMILSDLRSQLHGSIRLLFQPSEERLPGGALGMIQEGALKYKGSGPGAFGTMAAVFGQHVAPELESGTIGIRSGPYMASTDEIYLTINGEGGHAAEPHKVASDAVLVASHIVVALQSVISRNCPPEIPSVLSFGKIEGNGATNILSSCVKLEGTFRSFDEKWRFRAHEMISRVATSTAAAYGATCETEILIGYPMLINNPDAADFVRRTAIEFLGPEKVVDVNYWFASEDFAYFLQELPGTFYRLGTKIMGESHALHTPNFTIDESALETGAGFLAYLALSNYAA